MCLRVEYVPINQREGLIVPAFKILINGGGYWSKGQWVAKRFVTPYLSCELQEGWIFAERPDKLDEVVFDKWLGIGLVHSYDAEDKNYIKNRAWFPRKVFSCYAIGVKAYGCIYQHEIGSLAIYIPTLGDNKTTAKIEAVLQQPNRNKTMLYGIHKMLDHRLKKYW